MKLLYPALFHKESDGFWVEFPDLEGCYSQGDSIPDIYFNAKEALALYCSGEDSLPEPSDMYSLVVPENCFPSLVEVSISITDGVNV